MLKKSAAEKAVLDGREIENLDAFGRFQPFELLSASDKSDAIAMFQNRCIKGTVTLNEIVIRVANGTESKLYRDDCP